MAINLNEVNTSPLRPIFHLLINWGVLLSFVCVCVLGDGGSREEEKVMLVFIVRVEKHVIDQ